MLDTDKTKDLLYPILSIQDLVSFLKNILFFLRKEKIMALSKELLDILACPKCKGDIYLTDAGDGLICDHCKLLYEIKDDIPIMLIDEAKPLGD